MQNKKVYPLAYDVLGACADNFLKVAHFIGVERSASGNCAVTNFGDYSVQHNDFGARFTTLKFTMHMDWLMFVGVEHDD